MDVETNRRVTAQTATERNASRRAPGDIRSAMDRVKVAAVMVTGAVFIQVAGLLTLPAGSSAVDSAEVHPGLALLLNEPLSVGFFSLKELQQLWTVWEEDARQQAESSSDSARRALTFDRYGLIQRPEGFRSEAAAGWEPLGYVLMDSGRFAPNCLTCHGGKVAGEVMPGLPNSHQDFAGLVGDLAALRAKASGSDPDAARAGASFGIPLNFVAGSTNATMYSILLGSMRDEHLNARFPPQLSQPMVHNSIDAPPWWHFKKKSRIYWDGMAPKSVRTLMQFAMAPGLSGEKIRSFEDEFAVIRDFIDQVEPPKFPFDIDEELAATGRQAFERVCSECHGTYRSEVDQQAGSTDTYPERTVPLSLLGTDPVRLAAIKPESKEIYNRSWFSNYGQHPVIVDTRGYVAPPLDGIWATAPYFHNGSVPTLWHVLFPDQRPTVWKRTIDGYDQTRVGLEIVEFDSMPSTSNARERRQYFDSSIASHSTAGHRFPDKLTREERLAVLEYLKTL